MLINKDNDLTKQLLTTANRITGRSRQAASRWTNGIGPVEESFDLLTDHPGAWIATGGDFDDREDLAEGGIDLGTKECGGTIVTGQFNQATGEEAL